MRAKLLQHPAAAAGDLKPRTIRTPEATADSGMPPWFYAFTIVGLTAALLLGTPFNLPVLLVLWIYYFQCAIRSPERTIFIFVLTMVLLKTLPLRGIPLLPGMNSDTLFIATMALAAVMSRERQPQPPVPNLLLKPVVFFSIVLTVSAVLSFGMGSAMQHTMTRGWFPYSAGHIFSDLKSDLFYLFLGPIAFRLIWNRRQLVTALNVVAIYTGYIAVEALLARAGVSHAGLDVPKFLRVGGAMFKEPNQLGGFLAIATVALVPALLVRTVGVRTRVLIAATTAVSVAGLVYSFSRGAWVAALAGFLILALLRGAKGVFLLILLAMTATLWMPQAVIERYEHTVRTRSMGAIEDTSLDDSTEGRITRWKAVPGMFWEAPVIGHGYKSFPRTYGKLNESGRETGSHSTITAIIVEEGFVGVVAYSWLILAMFWGAYQLRKMSDDPLVQALALGTAAAVATLAVLDLTGNRLQTDGVMAAVWLLVGGVTRQYANLRYAETPPTTRTSRSSS